MNSLKPKNLLIYIVFGVVIGILLSVFQIEMSFAKWVLIFIVVCFIIITFFILSYNRPILLLRNGRVDDALNLYEQSLSKYSKNVKLVNISYYNIANCYILKGELGKSLEYLQKFDISKANDMLLGSFYTLYAGNLLLMEKDILKADEYILKALDLVNVPSIYILKAYSEVLKGDNDNAKSSLEKYFDSDKNSSIKFGIRVSLYFNQALEASQNDYLLGYCYMKMGDYELAKKYFTSSISYKYSNYYTERSRELAQQL